MDGFDLAAEERAESLRMIRDSAAAVVTRGDMARVRALRFTETGFDPAVLREMGELGWIGLRVPEAEGGAGLGMAECCALMEELGRGLVPEPLIPAMLSAAVLAGTGDALLPRVLSGAAYLPVAWQDRVDSLEVSSGPGPRLFVPAARGAEAFLVPVGDALHLATGVLEIQALQDGGHVATLRPDLAAARPVATGIAAPLARALDEAALATAAYLLGVMEEAFAITLAYLRTRQQFGRPIGSFQALQHRAVDLRIQIALTRASVEAAAVTLDSAMPEAAKRAAVSRAKARAAEAAMLVTRAAVQLHGAIGYTDEYDVGLFTRKAMVLSNSFGSAALHRRRFMVEAEEDATTAA